MRILRRLRRYFRPQWFGAVLVTASFYYLGRTFVDHYAGIALPLDASTVSVLIFMVLMGLGAYAVLAWSWIIQLGPSYPQIGFGWSLSCIGLSQIGKYLPGNVAHILGRGALAREHVKLADITVSFIVESAMMASVYLLFGLWYLSYLDLSAYIDPLRIVVTLVMGIVLAGVGYRYLRTKLGVYRLSVLMMIKLAGLNALMVLSGGFGIYLLAGLYPDIPTLSFMQYTAGFALSFVAGFLMPGAPAGIGVREALFVMLFAPWVGKPVALEIILVLRLVTMVTDGVLFALVRSMKNRLVSQSAP